MPVQTVTIRAHGLEHTKPVYLCETCLEPASYGFNTMIDNHKRRLWFCINHIPKRKEHTT